MKRVEIKVEGSIGDTRVVYITSQTHRNNEFGRKEIEWPTGFVFTASNGIRLMSCLSPHYCAESKILWVHGKNKAMDHRRFVVPKTDFELLQAAIAEYNKTFED